MTFLDLAKRIRQECAIAGSGPTTIVGQSGEYQRVVDWMSAAYHDIQAAHITWDFLRDDFSFATVAGTADYGVTQHAITDLNEWDTDTLRCYLTANDEMFLEYIPWEMFRDTWKIGPNRTKAARPSFFSVKPDNSLTFDVVPDAVYTIVGEYWKRPVAVGTDTDEPVFSPQFHMAIVWRALMLFGGYAAEPDKYMLGQDEYQRMLRRMAATLLPRIVDSAPLA